MKEDYLIPLESATKKEWRDCAVYHENSSYAQCLVNLKLEKENKIMFRWLSKIADNPCDADDITYVVYAEDALDEIKELRNEVSDVKTQPTTERE